MVQAIYQERTGNGVTLCLMCADSEPSANAGEAQVKQLAIPGEGDSLQAAWEDAVRSAGQELFLGQCRAWLVGENILDTLDGEDAAFWAEQDHGCAGMPMWFVDLTPAEAKAMAEQSELLLSALEYLEQSSGLKGMPAYRLDQTLQMLPYVAVSENGAVQPKELWLRRDGEMVLSWQREQIQLALWIQGEARRVELETEQGTLTLQWPTAAWGRSGEHLILRLEGALPDAELTPEEQSALEQHIARSVTELITQTLSAGADVFGLEHRQALLGTSGAPAVEVRLTAGEN
ncbi:MAG: hypothetical protein IJ484_03500 [Oscillospiraceae bacterium]|nr:hypothetical protein [Oscillospiraceae bacterium]